MTCFHPLLAEKVSPKSLHYNPKKKIKIIPNADIDLKLSQRESGYLSEFLYVPCGKCIGCRIDKARDWSVRLMCESYTSSSSWFLTLTYDDDHMDELSLNKKHFQQFIDDLRYLIRTKYNPDVHIRYFGCGEYGDRSGRRHLHIIVFNLPNLDITPYKAKNGIMYYQSEILNSIWQKGYVVLGELTPESAQYVARYTLKKQGTKDYSELDIQEPFLLMSTRPGIGYDYCMLNKHRLTRDWKILVGHDYAHIPRYFMRILQDDPDVGSDVIHHKEELKDLSFDRKFMQEFLNRRKLRELLTSEELNLLASQKEATRDGFDL